MEETLFEFKKKMRKHFLSFGEWLKVFFLKKRRKILFWGGLSLFLLCGISFFFSWSDRAAKELWKEYESRQSQIVSDRNGKILWIKPNKDGNLALYSSEIPLEFEKLLLQKEDRFFYSHPGINPISSIQALWEKSIGDSPRASSTLSQQLTKILLGNENNRTVQNKLREMAFALALETHFSKKEILEMYSNSLFLGNNVQGFSLASRLYFGSSLDATSESEKIQILASISAPSVQNPFLEKNLLVAKNLSKKLGRDDREILKVSKKEIQTRFTDFRKYVRNEGIFELEKFTPQCEKNCQFTIDKELTEKIRNTVVKNIEELRSKKATNAAVIVLKFPENQLLAIIGSPDPNGLEHGLQINMATTSRPIGSTVKPFLYAKAFEKKLRPYSLVDDREYKYITADGFSFYPKNYDYKYNGIVNLHYALSNSLNIPAVKVLEYVGIDEFWKFLSEKFDFSPIQKKENYELGIALGSLEMDLLHLSYFFSVFANNGVLKPLFIENNNAYFAKKEKVFEEVYVELINSILTDRSTSVDQFGQKSSLNLPTSQKIALKTGTSREYHDSWTIGYTPDFLVGVWVGNAQDEPMEELSGQLGAGKIWNGVMTLLLNSEYNKKTPFPDKNLVRYQDGETIEMGLKGDDFEKYKNLLMSKDKTTIVDPHDGDDFLFQEGMQIPLRASISVRWFVDGKFLAEGEEAIFSPEKAGKFQVSAKGEGREEESMNILVSNDEDE